MDIVCSCCKQHIWIDENDKIMFCLDDVHIFNSDLKEVVKNE